jgi:hypothetical protein
MNPKLTVAIGRQFETWDGDAVDAAGIALDYDRAGLGGQPPTPPASSSTTRSPARRLLRMEELELSSFGPTDANLSWSKVQVFIGGTFSLSMFSLLMRARFAGS